MNYDILFFLFYIILILFAGWKSTKKNPTQEEYLLSNRALSLPALVATIVTTWYGGILGVGEFIYSTGLAAWVVFGIPYYFFAALFAVFVAPKIRRSKYVSIPDLLYKNYGKAVGLLGSFFILFITSPAPYILITAIILSYLFNTALLWSVLAATFFSLIYVFKGGLNSIVYTDKIQFLFMFAGFIILISFLLFNYDSPLEIFNQLPDTHQNFSGGLSLQSIFVWFLIASWTFIDPGFHQRTSAARTPAVAKKAILTSIMFWFVFDMLTLWTGLYGVVLIKNADPLMIYPLLAEEVLPPFFKSIFIIGLLATAMSTVDSFSFLSAQTFGRDMVAFWNKKDSDEEVAHYTQIGLLLTAIIAIILIGLFPSVVSLWYNLGSLFIPPLLIPILTALYPSAKIDRKDILKIMVSGFSLSLFWYVYGVLNKGSNFLNIEPFLPGLVLSIILYFIFKNKRS